MRFSVTGNGRIRRDAEKVGNVPSAELRRGAPQQLLTGGIERDQLARFAESESGKRHSVQQRVGFGLRPLLPLRGGLALGEQLDDPGRRQYHAFLKLAETADRFREARDDKALKSAVLP